jgi:hypothetical protein
MTLFLMISGAFYLKEITFSAFSMFFLILSASANESILSKKTFAYLLTSSGVLVPRCYDIDWKSSGA